MICLALLFTIVPAVDNLRKTRAYVAQEKAKIGRSSYTREYSVMLYMSLMISRVSDKFDRTLLIRSEPMLFATFDPANSHIGIGHDRNPLQRNSHN